MFYQVFEKDDYRLVRFLNRPKEVNKNWAIKLINEVPPSPEKDRIVACNGGGGPLGHPKVYINLVRIILLRICHNKDVKFKVWYIIYILIVYLHKLYI